MTEFNKYNYSSKVFDVLLNKKVLGIYGDKEEISIVTQEGSYNFQAYGDCCSLSWFENISGVDNLVGHKVLSSREDKIEGPKRFEEHPYDYYLYYGWTIMTDKGHFQIEMRNCSNGYYGGSIDLSEGQNQTVPLKDF